MRIRGMLATTALLGTALLVHPATAEDETADACLLLQDALNDTAFQNRAELAGVLAQPDLDLVSADVATDAEMLYAVIRLQALGTTLNPNLEAPTTYRLEFASGSRRFFVQVPDGYASTWNGNRAWPWIATAGRVGGRSYYAHGEVDQRAAEVRVQAPLSAFGRHGIPEGAEITEFRATAVRTYSDHGQLAPGVSSRVTFSDIATSNETYVAGAPSCITPEPVEVIEEPTQEPTVEPEPEPTAEPEPEPTQEPTTEPEPTEEPAPTEEPTEEPSPSPAP